MFTKVSFRIAVTAALLAVFTSVVYGGPVVAYSDPTGAGNQTFGGTLGMDFIVNSPNGIDVSAVGAFDSNQDGLKNAISVSFWNVNTLAKIFSTSIPTTGTTLVGGDQFLAITPFHLAPGTYSVVAEGFSASDPNGNSQSSLNYSTLNTNGGAISFVDSSRWGTVSGAFPTTIDGAVARYGAGTFQYDVTPGGGGAAPEPATFALVGGGLLGLCFLTRRFKQN